MTRPAALAVALAALILALAAPAANAAPCSKGEDGTAPFTDDTMFFDSQGYEWDISLTPAAQDRTTDEAMATFFDGGANSSLPARSPGDSYDGWGALYVGNDLLPSQYHQPNNDACSLEDGDRELVFPVVSIHGFEVQRKIFVSTSGLPGARILDIVRNPSQGASSTSVQVGDLQAAGGFGDFGSDNQTKLHFSSSGDGTLDSADLWGVTGDNNGDYTLAHVFDGQGGADRVDFVQLGTGSAASQEKLAYRWDGVTLAPGETAAFLSYEIQQAVESGDEAAEAIHARDRALDYQAMPFTQLYAAMTDAEIRAVRNWPKPPPGASFDVSASPNDELPTSLSVSAMPAVAGPCQDVTYAWEFGDGGTASGAAVQHRFKAGTFQVTLRATNSCGGAASTTQSVVVADVSPACVNVIAPGTSAADTISGTAFGDRMRGGKGNDKLNGLAGIDCLAGDSGDDILKGGTGHDRTLSGGSGNDRADGGSGNDGVRGDKGDDRLKGGRGNDKISGGAGDDSIDAGKGTNTVSGGTGDDRISAKNGRKDRIKCGAGKDSARVDRIDSVSGCETVRV